MIRLRVQGGAEVTLTQADFLGQGAEGAVYARGGLAFKVYPGAGACVPPAKIRELAVLTDPRILRPLDLLLDARGEAVGYTMRRVERGQPLGRLFTRAFRERMGLTPERVLELVGRLQEGVAHVHQHGILIVDLNELNFLLDTDMRDVFFIDVAAYQTAHFPATALMESIRDRHASRFTEGTDWFSFAVISFQMFTGIHPFRGKHPTLPDLDSRMLANVSVLNPEVQVPPACYPFSVIPGEYLDWYRAVFEDGRRDPPPVPKRGGSGHRTGVGVGVRVRVGTEPLTPDGGELRMRELARFPAAIVAPALAREGLGALTVDGFYLRGRRHPVPAEAQVVLAPQSGRLLAAWTAGGSLRLYDVSEGREVPAAIAVEALTACEGRLYAKQGGSLYEVELIELPAGIRVALRGVGNALENATELFDGVAVQTLPGACYVSVFPRAGTCCTVRLPELDGRRVLGAKYDGGVVAVTAERDGGYARLIFRFEADHRAYDARETAVPSPAHPDFVTLETGVCLCLDDSGELDVFPCRPGTTERRLISSPLLGGARLFRDGARALLVRGDALFEISTAAGP